MASVHKTKEGGYIISFYIKGKRFRKRVGKNKSAAYKLAADIEYFLKIGDFRSIENVINKHKNKSSHINISDAIKQFLKQKQIKGVKKNTLMRLTEFYNYVNDFLIERNIDNPQFLDEDDFLIFLREKYEKGLKRSSLKRYKILLNAFIRFLIKKYDCEIDIERFSKESSLIVGQASEGNIRIKTITLEEMRKIINNLNNKVIKVVLWTIYYTGMRRSEAVSLKKEDIDFDKKFISIKSGKTKNAKRDIPIHTELMKILNNYIKENKLKDGEYLFPGLKESTHISESAVTHSFLYAQRRANFVETYRLHDLRHSFASKLIEKTNDYKTVSELLGHASISTTLDIYGHISNKRKVEIIKEFK